MKLVLGSEIVGSYRRLPYKAWYAIAEFVDNSTQSYFDHKEQLDLEYSRRDERLTVRVVYDFADDLLRVYDNAMGMSYEELERALHLAKPPDNRTGRSRYGLGLKTAAFWIGNTWSIRTKKLGETIEHRVTVTLEEVISGQQNVNYQYTEGKDPDDHYTILEIRDHNHEFKGRTLGKIKDYLRSIYRTDLREGLLTLEWRGEELKWEEPVLLTNIEGEPFHKEYEFDVDDKHVTGWVGILERGGRPKAGFSILQAGRVIRGWPNAWRPRELYGQEEGSNNLVNQRLVGEIHLDGFEVTHTKDDIQWLGDEEERVEKLLLDRCGDYKSYAQEYRINRYDGRGPTDAATQTAIDELKRELESPEMVDRIVIDVVPPREAIEQTFDEIVDSVTENRVETFRVGIGMLSVVVYVIDDMSPFEPYVVSEPSGDKVIVIVNMAHPHWQTLDNLAVLNYLRHCVYDGVAEWQARAKATRIDPNTIRLLKDNLLRVPFEMEQHQGAETNLD